jgi:isopentenyl-diphosphate Delta-isomerase
VSRANRKQDHINYALATGQKRAHGLDDISFIHNCIPNCAIEEISLQSEIGELTISSPFFINAMTGGGGTKTEDINRQLAEVANVCDLPIAVGSQMSAIKDKAERKTFEVVRKVNSNGIVFANIGSEATVDQAKEAVEMLEANALQIHLNVIQELVMPEGDRDFRGALKRIERFVNKVEVPIIVKEVGFGMSAEAVSKLNSIGVKIVDIGGFGGTNFAKVENKRRSRAITLFNDWGIPTSVSIAEAKQSSDSMTILASGGIQSSNDVAKAIALGANAVGMAGFILKILMQNGQEALIEEIQNIQEELTLIMTALGVTKIEQFQQVPLIISGSTYSWLEQRGISTTKYAQKK